jgi:PAS domain S-box-containing protein
MGKDTVRPEDTAQLRRRAEKQLQQRESPPPPEHQAQVEPPPRSEPQAQRLLHELEVHQIELELQNAELLQAREELEGALEQYTELYDFAPVGYFTLNPEGVIRASNLAGATLLGVERSRLLGRSFLPFVAAKDRASFTAFLGKVITGMGKEELELGLAPQQEGSAPLFVKVEAVTDSTGKKCRVAAIDITRRKKVEEELERYREHLEWLVGERTRSLEAEIFERRRAELAVKELNSNLEQRVAERTVELQSTIRDLQTFSYSISHDLRTPLRSINSFASVLLEDFSEGLNEEGKRLVTSIVQRTVNMGTLIDDILTFSKISMQQLVVYPIDMTVLVHELVGKLQGDGISAQFQIAELPRARGDRSMIAQVLENLLANAVKFSRKEQRPLVEVGYLTGEKENVYFVKDNGVGFDMKYVEAIFGVFQRLHSVEEFEGTGVGLAIVEQIITKQGGRVWAERRPGEGATFYFSLPKG